MTLKLRVHQIRNNKIKYRNLTRRVFVAKTDIKKKEILTTKNLAAKRSAKINGYYDIQKLLGKKTKSEIKKDTVITINNLKWVEN